MTNHQKQAFRHFYPWLILAFGLDGTIHATPKRANGYGEDSWFILFNPEHAQSFAAQLIKDK